MFARALRSFVNTLLFVAALGVFGGLVVAGVDVWRDGRCLTVAVPGKLLEEALA